MKLIGLSASGEVLHKAITHHMDHLEAHRDNGEPVCDACVQGPSTIIDAFTAWLEATATQEGDTNGK